MKIKYDPQFEHMPEYHVWVDMMRRCYDPTHSKYSEEGAVGIEVCKRWHRFENFYNDMGPMPPRGPQLS